MSVPGIDRAYTSAEYRAIAYEAEAELILLEEAKRELREDLERVLDSGDAPQILRFVALVLAYPEKRLRYWHKKSRLVEATRWVEGRVRQC